MVEWFRVDFWRQLLERATASARPLDVRVHPS
jgi:hypothetical protein